MFKNGFSNGNSVSTGGVKNVLRSRPTRHLATYTLLLLVTAAIWYVFARPMKVPSRGPAQSSVIIHKTAKEIDVISSPEEKWYEGPRNQSQLEKAALVMLVRNSELHPARSTMREIEDRFNKRFGYPWVFLNDEPFTDEFIKLTTALATGRTEYALIPKEYWGFPNWVNQEKAHAKMREMDAKKILYGGSLSYRHMCRFNSGFFYRMDVMQKYDFYWRIEPFTEYYCDLYYDPFTFMRENNKKYGWVMSLIEFEETIPTLWSTIRTFTEKYPTYVAEDNAHHFMVDDPTKGLDGKYNLCHFWSNFEIADLRWFRSKVYSDYFEYLDKTGGFFYERWGDAPVHSIAATFFLPKDQIHFFHDIGYRHSPYIRCPQDEESHLSGRCSCERENNFDYEGYSCMRKWDRVFRNPGPQQKKTTENTPHDNPSDTKAQDKPRNSNNDKSNKKE